MLSGAYVCRLRYRVIQRYMLSSLSKVYLGLRSYLCPWITVGVLCG